MEPPPGSGPDELGGLRVDLLRRAVDVYLKLAYPSGEIPESVQRRLIWPQDADSDAMFVARLVRTSG